MEGGDGGGGKGGRCFVAPGKLLFMSTGYWLVPQPVHTAVLTGTTKLYAQSEEIRTYQYDGVCVGSVCGTFVHGRAHLFVAISTVHERVVYFNSNGFFPGTRFAV